MAQILLWATLMGPWFLLIPLDIKRVYLFYFTYSRPFLFFAANFAADAFQAFVISPFVFEKLGLYKMGTMSNLGLFLILFSLVPIIYFYQRWYEKGIISN
jgi:hypothetical protein